MLSTHTTHRSLLKAAAVSGPPVQQTQYASTGNNSKIIFFYCSLSLSFVQRFNVVIPFHQRILDFGSELTFLFNEPALLGLLFDLFEVPSSLFRMLYA